MGTQAQSGPGVTRARSRRVVASYGGAVWSAVPTRALTQSWHIQPRRRVSRHLDARLIRRGRGRLTHQEVKWLRKARWRWTDDNRGSLDASRTCRTSERSAGSWAQQHWRSAARFWDLLESTHSELQWPQYSRPWDQFACVRLACDYPNDSRH